MLRDRCALPCPLAWHTVEEITEQCLITLTDEKTWELANQPSPQPPRELSIAAMFKAMQHQCAKQNLASRVLPPLLFAQSGLERSLAFIELVDALLNGCSWQGSDPFIGGTKPDMFVIRSPGQADCSGRKIGDLAELRHCRIHPICRYS